MYTEAVLKDLSLFVNAMQKDIDEKIIKSDSSLIRTFLLSERINLERVSNKIDSLMYRVTVRSSAINEQDALALLEMNK